MSKKRFPDVRPFHDELLSVEPLKFKFIGSARERSVRVKNELKLRNFFHPDPTLGSGVIIETGLVFTNFHVVEQEGQITVNDHPAELIHWNIRNDLAALSVKTRKLRKVEFDIRARRTQAVFCVGNPDACNKSITTGEVNFVDKRRILASVSSTEGISGAGLYSMENGALVGILDSMTGNMAMAIPARLVIDFLKEAWPIFNRRRP